MDISYSMNTQNGTLIKNTEAIGNPTKNFLHLNVKGNYTHRMVKTVFGDDLWTHV